MSASLASKTAFSFNVTQSSGFASNDILSDGSYSEKVIARATEIALTDFNITASMLTEKSPIIDTALSDAFELVEITLFINVSKVKVPVVKNIISHHTKLCISHLLKVEDAAEIQSRVLLAHRIKILAHECLIFNYEIPEKQALKLLEFIYRYGEDGYRYQQAFQKLYSSIKNESLALIFDKFVQYFDSNRQTLPVMVSQLKMSVASSGPLISVFTSFMRNLYEKIINIVDPIEDNEIFCRHINMIITSIISCGIVDFFIEILLEILPFIDPLSLISSPRFCKSAVEFIQQAPKHNSLLLDYFVGLFLNEQIIAKIGEENEKKIAGLLYNLRINYENSIDKYFHLLSTESKIKLQNIEKRHNQYEKVFSFAEQLKYLQINFTQLSKNHLQNMKIEIDELVEFYGNLFEFDGQRLSLAVGETAKYLKDLVQSAQKDVDSKFLNFDRFKVFLSILNYLMKNEFILSKAKIPFIKILQFFNENVTEFDKIEEILSIVKSQMAVLIKEKQFLTTEKDFKILFKFLLKLIGKESAIEEFRQVLLLTLKNSDSFVEFFGLLKNICRDTEIEVSVVAVPFLQEEVKRYLEVPKSEKTILLTYENGHLLNVIAQVIKSECLSHSEMSILNAFSLSYSTFIHK